MSVLIGIDIGGTFTDIVALNEDTGELKVTKVPSTPGEFSKGFFNGLDKILEVCGGKPEEIKRLVHGTTVATNAILEKKGAKIGILTTKGFRDVLIIGRGTRNEQYNVHFDSETPSFLCPRERIKEVRERVDAKGDIIEPLNEEDVIRAVDFLVKEQKVESIAICYLFSFFNKENEERTRDIILKRYPGLRVSVSSKINPRFREYERMVVTAFDAYIGPVMDRYITKLNTSLAEIGVKNSLQLMQSRGGVTSSSMCSERPVLTLLSGPAAGVIGAKQIAQETGRKNILTLDLGGTSNDVSLIQNGETKLFTDGKIGNYPCRQAMMDISTIGAGGGSIAWVDGGGWLRVGPHSAGSFPGPACYGKGGTEPTYTDASLIMGYLRPDYFAGGEVALDAELARKAIQEKVADVLDMGIYDAASAIHKIMHNQMADQVRLATVKRGYDPRSFSVVASGGAGPIAACSLLKLLNFKEVIVPPTPGVMAALGLLSADIEHEEVVTFAAKIDEVDLQELKAAIGEGKQLCGQERANVGISENLLRTTYSAEMRYVGQSYELEIPFPEAEGVLDKAAMEAVKERFHQRHEHVYKHAFRNLQIEFTAIRILISQKPVPTPRMEKVREGEWGVPGDKRRTYFDECKGWMESDVYNRENLAASQVIIGPAIVEQTDTTILIYPDQKAIVDQWGNLIVTMMEPCKTM